MSFQDNGRAATSGVASHPTETQVAIIGGGPAGLLLGHLLNLHGVETVIVEARARRHCEARLRAGVLEQGTRDVLIDAGVGDRLQREGLMHHGIYLRFGGESHRIALSDHAEGRTVTVYGQTEVVRDLIAARLQSGAPMHFECSDVRIEGVDGSRPIVRYLHDGSEHELRCKIVAGCDGFHGISRQAIPPTVLRTWDREYPFAWLGILADVAPSTDELIYARHDRGFALHSMRSPSVSRLYVQVGLNETIDEWSDARVWDELDVRLATDGWTLTHGPVLDKSITAMRSFVAAPMRYHNLFLAGDAAHIVPPTGAKGLNLAVGDVTLLAHGLVDHFMAGRDSGLEEYSDRRLDAVWRAQHFSWWMTQMLHVNEHDDAYGDALALSQLRYICESPVAAATLAENYVGFAQTWLRWLRGELVSPG
jgi:p-hydroxybenzoate 3-monooxygenase